MPLINWFTAKKQLPQFWKDYKTVCKSYLPDHYVAFDCETTGLDPQRDRLLSIGAIKFSTDRIFINQSIELFIKQENIDEKSVAIHGILPQDAADAHLSEKQAIIEFLRFIENATLVGHHINFDKAMINQALRRMHLGKLKNKTRDTNHLFKKKYHYPIEQNISLDNLCNTFSVKTSNRHTALGDAYLTAINFQRLLEI